ncbi:hypothetical protein NMG60_11000097 [Bertholletia excelsa]
MALPSSETSANPIRVIGPQYCHPYPFDLAIVRKILALTKANFVITDVNENILFKVKGGIKVFNQRRTLLDAAGNAIVTLQRKMGSAHGRWQVFRGESTDPAELLFSAKKSSFMQPKKELNVYLAGNTTKEVCNFKVQGSWLKRSCVIYAGESSTIVAQMHKKLAAGSILLGKDRFMVTVYPQVDYAFIAALIVIFAATNRRLRRG